MKAIEIIKYFLGPFFCLIIILAFVTEKPISVDENEHRVLFETIQIDVPKILIGKPVAPYGDEFRIFYFHVPSALVGFIAFLVNLVYSIRYLRKGDARDDLKAAASAEIGLIFCLLATLSGSIFARATWGVFWNWDIRQTTIVVLLAVYGAYFALRSALEPEERRATFSSVYSILAFPAVPTFGLVIPRLYYSLHPSDTLISGGKLALGPMVAVVFFGSMLAFCLLYVWLFNLRWRIGFLERIQAERSYE